MHFIKFLALICFSGVLSATAIAQIKPVEEFLAANKEVDKYYIYQSSLRMLNQQAEEDFNKLIKDLRKINVYVSESATGETQPAYQKMISALNKDAFETLVSAKYDGIHVNFLGKDSGRSAYYVLALTEGNSFTVMEMDGQLDLRYLGAIENMDFDKLRKIVGQDGSSEDEGSDH